MNTNNTIFPNIGNRNTTCHDVGNDETSRMLSWVSKETSETAQQKGISFIPQASRLGDEHNGIHSNKNKRTVDLNGAETYLTPSDRNDVVCHESIDSNNDTENLLGSREWPNLTETAKSFFTSLVPQMKKGCKAFAWNPKPKVIAASLFSACFPEIGLMGKTIMTLCAVVGGATATSAGSEVNTTPPDKVKRSNNMIGINDIKMLEKIGRHKDFPSNGSYELTANIDAINFTHPIKLFTGDFNGKDHTISNLQRSLVVNIHNGAIRNLIMSHANIHNHRKCLAVLACHINGTSKISHTQFENSQIQHNKASSYNAVGMVASEVSNSAQIENISVKNCIIDTEKSATWSGFLAGMMYDTSKSNNNTVDNCSLTTHSYSSLVGSLVGLMYGESLSSNDKVNNCSLAVNGPHSGAGGAVGRLEPSSKIIKVRVSDTTVEGNEEHSSVGIVAGSGFNRHPNKNASISESTAINSRATVTYESSKVGIWVGESSENLHIYNNTHSNCTIESPASNTTTTEPAMIADDVAFLSLGVSLAGVAVTATSVGLVGGCAYSFYSGYQEGKRGRSLAMHPFASFGKLLNNCCKSFTGFQPVATNHIEDEMALVDM